MWGKVGQGKDRTVIYDERGGMEMGQMNDRTSGSECSICLHYQKEDLTSFQTQLIIGNYCEGFLDMRCVMTETEMEIYYSSENRIRMDEILRYSVWNASDILRLCREFLKGIFICEEYLLHSDELSFSDEYIFCRGTGDEVRFLYAPGNEDSMGVREKLVNMVDTGMEQVGDDMIEILLDYKKSIYSGSFSTSALIDLTEDYLRRSSSAGKAGLEREQPLPYPSRSGEREGPDPVRVNETAEEGGWDEPFRRSGKRNDTAPFTGRGLRGHLRSLWNELVS